MMSPGDGILIVRVEFDDPCRVDSPNAEKEAVLAYFHDTNFFESWEFSCLYILVGDGTLHRQFFI
jgi:hypothetical protein